MGREEVKEAALQKVGAKNTFIDTRAEERAGSKLVEQGSKEPVPGVEAEREPGVIEGAGFHAVRGKRERRKKARAAAQAGLEQALGRVCPTIASAA